LGDKYSNKRKLKRRDNLEEIRKANKKNVVKIARMARYASEKNDSRNDWERRL